MNNNNLNFELVQMRQLRFENDMMKRAVYALLENNLKSKQDVKDEENGKVLTDKDDILTNFKTYLNENQLADNNLSKDSTFQAKREEVGPYYPPGRLSSNDAQCQFLGHA